VSFRCRGSQKAVRTHIIRLRVCFGLFWTGKRFGRGGLGGGHLYCFGGRRLEIGVGAAGICGVNGQRSGCSKFWDIPIAMVARGRSFGRWLYKFNKKIINRQFIFSRTFETYGGFWRFSGDFHTKSGLIEVFSGFWRFLSMLPLGALVCRKSGDLTLFFDVGGAFRTAGAWE